MSNDLRNLKIYDFHNGWKKKFVHNCGKEIGPQRWLRKCPQTVENNHNGGEEMSTTVENNHDGGEENVHNGG